MASVISLRLQLARPGAHTSQASQHENLKYLTACFARTLAALADLMGLKASRLCKSGSIRHIAAPQNGCKHQQATCFLAHVDGHAAFMTSTGFAIHPKFFRRGQMHSQNSISDKA